MKMTFETEITLPVTLVCDVDLGPAGSHHAADGSWAEPDERGVALLEVCLETSHVRGGINISGHLNSDQLAALQQEAAELAQESADEE